MSATTTTPQALEYINFAKEIKKVLDYDKNLTYYLTVTYDMLRLYTVYLIIYAFIAAKCSWAFVLFASFMCCSILYILDRGIVVSLTRYFERVEYDEYHLHTDSTERGNGQAKQPHHNYVYATLKNPTSTADNTIYF